MKTVTEYSTDNGTVMILQGTKYFCVACHTLISPGGWRIREFGRLSYEEALEKFAEMKAELNNCVYAKPRCKYSSVRTRPCNSRNCPKRLGGAAFWEIFSNTCCYKTR